jgi:hypothetical protein
VILEIEEYAASHADDPSNNFGSIGGKELMPDFEHTDEILKIGNDIEGLSVAIHIQGENKTVFCGHGISHEAISNRTIDAIRKNE